MALQEEMNNVKVQDGIYLNGDLHDLQVINLYLTEKAMKTWVSLQGNIEINIVKENYPNAYKAD